MNDEMFYGTLPQDTQDFSQVLRGVGRSIRDIGRGVSYYPYDLIGAPVDIINMALQPVGLGSEQPVMGSDYLRNIAQSLGYAQPSTGSGAETAGRFAAGLTNPAAGARAVGQAGNLVTKGANISADKLVQMITGNPQATAPKVLEETSMPFMQAMAPRTPTAPSLLEPQKSDIGFYSQLEAATIPLQNKGTGDQYLAQISKTAGVKPEEIQWTGLDEFLKGKKSVTKDEILSYLNTNRVDVKEVQLSTPQSFDSPEEAINYLAVQFERTPEEIVDIYKYEDPYDYTIVADELAADVNLTTNFSDYTLPGGENYREILLTLPVKELTEAQARVVLGAAPDAKLSAADIAYASRKNVNEYRSRHFDEPNILAHMRVNDRVVDGKKTLFIEEIQSDWHQAGRKQGYVDPKLEEKSKELMSRADEVAQKAGFRNALHAAEGWQMHGIEAAKEANDLWVAASKAGPPIDAVPNAPFKTSWHELALKRAIQEASEKGYDQIAFTTGKTQAERYDLSQQIDEINVVGRTNAATGEQTKSVALDTTDGRSLRFGVNNQGIVDNVSDSSMSNFVGKGLDEVIGKDLAQKIMDGGSQTISGEGLKVGGEGMKGFYDNILPKSLDKLAKKFDAKVGKTEMDGVEVWQMDITPKMRESVTTKGQPLFAVPAVGAGLLGAGMMQNEEMY